MTTSNREAAKAMGSNVLAEARARDLLALAADPGDSPSAQPVLTSRNGVPVVKIKNAAPRHIRIVVDDALFARDAHGKRYAINSFDLALCYNGKGLCLSVCRGDTEAVVKETARCLLAAHGLDQPVDIEWQTANPYRFADAVRKQWPTAQDFEREYPATFVGHVEPHNTLTFNGSPTDLRSLHDAIGQAIETGTGHAARFNGGPVVVTRDEMLFSPTVTMDGSGGLPATWTIAADSKHLRTLRVAVDEARETGKAPPREWGKGRRVAVERVGDAPKVAEAPSEVEPVRYDGNAGGAQAWRWEVGE